MRARSFVGIIVVFGGMFCFAFAVMATRMPLVVEDRWFFFIQDLVPALAEEDVRLIARTLADDSFRRTSEVFILLGLLLSFSGILNVMRETKDSERISESESTAEQGAGSE